MTGTSLVEAFGLSISRAYRFIKGELASLATSLGMKSWKLWTEDRAIAQFDADPEKYLRIALRCATAPSDRAHLKIIVAANEGRGVTLTADEVGYLGMDDALQTAAENIAWEVLTGIRDGG